MKRFLYILLLTTATAHAQTYGPWGIGYCDWSQQYCSPTSAVTATLANGVLTISGSGAMMLYTYDSQYPWHNYRSQITSVVVGNGIDYVRPVMFANCTNLTSVTLGSGVEAIGGSAFYGCTSLASIVLPNFTGAIQQSAFQNCTSLTEINLSGIYTIEQGAFQNCTSLTEITIKNLTSISASTFQGCTNLAAITIPASVTSIGQQAFYGCTSLPEITLPNSLTSIGQSAFANCTSLTEIALPNNLTSIGQSAFQGCTNTGITSVTIPASVTSIGASAFSGCTSLAAAAVLRTASAPTLGNNAFQNTAAGFCVSVPPEAMYAYAASSSWSALTCVNGCQKRGAVANSTLWWQLCDSTLIVGGTGALPSYFYNSTPNQPPWFSYRNQIASVVIESGVTGINDSQYEYSAFGEFPNLTSVTIPNSVTYIGSAAFNYCRKLTSILLPDSLTGIGGGAFQGSALTEITIPNSVTSIGAGAFNYCTSLTEITIPANVATVGDAAFSYCTALASITLNNSAISTRMFQSCRSLASVTIPANVTSIGNYAFQNCVALTTVNSLSLTAPALGTNVFQGVNSEFCVWVPLAALFNYGNSAWSTLPCINGCTKIGVAGASAWWRLCDSTLSIGGAGAMTDFSSTSAVPWYSSYHNRIAYVEIEDGVTSVGNNAFNGCANLHFVNLPASIAGIGASAFQSCTKLTSITLPNSLTSVGASAFSQSNLSGITLPASVASVGASAFASCTNLTSLTALNSAPPALANSNAFQGVHPTFCVSVPPQAHGEYWKSSSWRNFLCTDCVSGSAGVGVAWSLCLDGQLVISGAGAMENFANGTTPWYDYRSFITAASVMEGVTSVGEYAFQGCANLTDVNLPTSLTSISAYAFSGCTGITKIAIPLAVTSIGDYAFQSCANIATIISLNPTPPTAQFNTFTSIPVTCCVFVPQDAETTYRTTSYWSRFAACIPEGINMCVISFDAMGGSPAPPTQTVIENSLATHPKDPVREGYDLVGWYEDNVNWSVPYDFTAPVVQSALLYAKWILRCTVIFDAQGGTPEPSQVLSAGETLVEPNPTPARYGYTFGGWYADTTNSWSNPAWNFASPVAQSMTLFARWNEKNYTVTFNAMSGNAVPQQQVQEGELASAPLPTRAGYAFDGWYISSAYATLWDFDHCVVTQDTTLYAKWLSGHTVTFNSMGGSAVDPQAVPHEGTAAYPYPPPTRWGYSFVDWYSDTSNNWDNAAYSFSALVTASITLYAKWAVASYTVAFNAMGGSAVSSQTVLHNSLATTPTPAPTRWGYTFAGWHADSTSWSDEWHFATPITSSMTLFAKWQPLRYRVTFNACGGTPTTHDSVAHNTFAAAPASSPTRAGYDFAAWYADTSNSWSNPAWDFTTDRITSDTTLYAKWELKRYRVTFNVYGGTPEVPFDSVAHGFTAAAPANPTREGYNFGGWYADTTNWNATSYNFSTPITNDITLFAKWTLKKYQVTFNAYGGSPTTQDSVLHGHTATAPANNPTREGYNFGGWYADTTNWNNPAYNFATPITADLTLFAKWTLKKYRVTFDAYGGTPTTQDSVLHGHTATAPAGNPTRTGYNFGGWYADTTNWNATAYNFATPITADITLFAKWTLKKYQVTFNAYGGSPTTQDSVLHGHTATAPATAPTRTGYSFGGWYADTTNWNAAAYNFATPITSDITLFAKWTLKKYRVTFNAYGGTPTTQDSVLHGHTATAPATAPTRTGYSFGGWYADTTNWNATSYNFATPITSDLTLFAKWTLKKYQVTFNAYGGSPTTQDSVLHGHTATAPASNPTREGYNFGGWYADTTNWNAAAYNFATPIANDLTLFAKWTLKKYQVTFNAYGGSPTTQDSVLHGHTATAPANNPTRVGYNFVAWYADTTNWNAASYNFATPIANDLTLFAKWTLKKYQVTFNAYGGSPTTQDSVLHGHTATEPATAPTRTGYSFVAWYADTAEMVNCQSSNCQWNFAVNVITSDTTLFAKWSEKPYTVTFDAQGGDYTPSPQTVLYRSFAAAPDSAPAKLDHYFMGWYGDTASNEAWRFDHDRITSDTTLFAKWSKEPIHLVTFDPRGGSDVPPQTIKHDSLATEPTAPTRWGYTFGGWYADSVSWDSAWNFAADRITSDTMLFAKWKINVYRVTLNPRNGEPTTHDSIPHGSTVPRPENPEREEYTFGGWYADTAEMVNCQSSNCQWNFATDRITSDTTLYAKWTQDSVPPNDSVPLYIVTFNARGGTPAFTQDTVRRGSLVPQPENPIRESYTFGGWYADTTQMVNCQSSNCQWNFATDTIASDTTLYAQWTRDTIPVDPPDTALCTVTFNALGGSPAITYQTVKRGSLVLRPANPMRRGYGFGGWFSDLAFDTLWSFDVDSVTRSITLYANWTLDELFITIITPNGDGINDCLEIPQKLLQLPNELTIFSRAGFMVYQKKNYDNNDFCGAGLLEGTYFYLFTYTAPDGKTHKIFNSVFITRE